MTYIYIINEYIYIYDIYIYIYVCTMQFMLCVENSHLQPTYNKRKQVPRCKACFLRLFRPGAVGMKMAVQFSNFES